MSVPYVFLNTKATQKVVVVYNPFNNRRIPEIRYDRYVPIRKLGKWLLGDGRVGRVFSLRGKELEHGPGWRFMMESTINEGFPIIN